MQRDHIHKRHCMEPPYGIVMIGTVLCILVSGLIESKFLSLRQTYEQKLFLEIQSHHMLTIERRLRQRCYD